MAISKSTLVLALATLFCAAPANADIVYGITGTYLRAYGAHGLNDPLPDIYVPTNHWSGTVVTDDTCVICTPGNGLLAMDLYFGSAVMPDIHLATTALASFDSQRAYLIAVSSFGTYIGVNQPQGTGITGLRSFWIDGHGAGDLAGTYTITPEPASGVLLLSALALAAKLRPRLLPHATRTHPRP